MNDREYRVIGVLPASFEPLDAERFYKVSAEIGAPIGYDLNGDSSCRGCRHLRAFARLKRGVSPADASAEMNTIREQMRIAHPGSYEAGSLAVVPLRRARARCSSWLRRDAGLFPRDGDPGACRARVHRGGLRDGAAGDRDLAGHVEDGLR